MVISIDQMKHRLHPLDRVRTALAHTEPLSTFGFAVGDSVAFYVDPGWQNGLDAKPGGDPVDASLSIGRGAALRTFQLTKDALLEATSICGIPKTYASRCPASLLEPQLNYWFQTGLANRSSARDYQVLVTDTTAAAITRASLTPFSNLRLLDNVLDGLRSRFGEVEVYADYKFVHSLRRTHLRLIVPDQRRTITGTGVDGDEWSMGLQIKNSLTGDERTSIDGYLFRWACTNGAIDTRATSGVWSRRGGSSESDVYEWARIAVDDVLGGLEASLDAVQDMVTVPIEGQAIEVLQDVFAHYHVPLPDRTKIIENMIEANNLTMYAVMAAVTEAANDPAMDPSHIENLLRMGGDLPHAAHSRCDACRRLLPA